MTMAIIYNDIESMHKSKLEDEEKHGNEDRWFFTICFYTI